MPSIDSITKLGVTPLMVAAYNGKLQAVKYLPKQGADPSLQNNKGWNVLHHASWGGNVAIMEKILSYGVHIESKTKFSLMPLVIVQMNGNSKAVAYLVSKGARSS